MDRSFDCSEGMGRGVEDDKHRIKEMKFVELGKAAASGSRLTVIQIFDPKIPPTI